MPDGYQLIEFSFSALVLGTFEEKFYFHIDGTEKKVEFVVQGEVIGPTFLLNPPYFNLGVVSLGFPIEQEITIKNTSLVEMEYDLITNGYEEETDLIKFENNAGKLKPESERVVKFTISPSEPKLYNLSIGVNVQDVGENISQCAIKFESQD